MRSDTSAEILPTAWWQTAVLSVAVYLSAWAAIILTRHTGHIAAIWISNALVVAALLKSPVGDWPRTIIVGASATAAANLSTGDSPLTSFVLPLCNMVEALIVAIPLRHFRLDRHLAGAIQLTTFYGLALTVGPVCSALLATSYLHWMYGGSFGTTMFTWYAADALGLATVTPVMVSLSVRDMKTGIRAGSLAANLGMIFLLVGVLALIRQFPQAPLAFLLFPVVLLFTFVRGYWGVAIALAITAAAILRNVAVGAGFLSQEIGSFHWKLALFQLFLFTLSGTAMVTGAVLAERRALVQKLKLAKREALDAAAAAENANRSKSSFLANMSHELRTPLNAIIGFSEVMKDGLLGARTGQNVGQYSALIHEAGTHLLSLINDVLDMSKIEAGKLELAIEQVDLDRVAEECVQLCAPQASQTGVALHVENFAEDSSTRADRRAVRQILLNLLSNAIKFTPSGGRIVVRIGTNGPMMTLTVADTGIGIAASQLPRLGRPFEQVRTSTSHSHPGTGLGLALVRALAEKHGGGMTIESVPSRGTSVTVSLPRPDRYAQAGTDRLSEMSVAHARSAS